MSKCKGYARDELFCRDDYKSCANKADADTSSFSDTDDFEKLSIPDSEPMSDDEVVMDDRRCGHALNGADVSQSSSETAQIVPFSFRVQKPPVAPTVLTAPTPSVRTEVCRKTLDTGMMERSRVFNELVKLASNINELMV